MLSFMSEPAGMILQCFNPDAFHFYVCYVLTACYRDYRKHCTNITDALCSKTCGNYATNLTADATQINW